MILFLFVSILKGVRFSEIVLVFLSICMCVRARGC